MLVSLSKRDGGNVMECTGSCNWHWKLSHLLSAQGTYMKICKHMQQWEQFLNARTAVGAWTSLFFWTLWDLCSILFLPASFEVLEPRAKTDMLKLHVRVSVYTTYTQTIHTQTIHTKHKLLPTLTTLTDSYRLLPTLTDSYRLLPTRSRVTGWDGCKDQFFVATQLLNRPGCHHDCWSNDLCLAQKKGYHSHPTWKFNQLNTIDEDQRWSKYGATAAKAGPLPSLAGLASQKPSPPTCQAVRCPILTCSTSEYSMYSLDMLSLLGQCLDEMQDMLTFASQRMKNDEELSASSKFLSQDRSKIEVGTV